jgi:hypothetical protein
MKAVKQIAGWSFLGMVVMMLIPVGVYTARGSFLGRAWSYDFDISLWTVFSHGAPAVFEFLFWCAFWIFGLYLFFKWAGSKISLFPTLLTAGWMIAGSVALFAMTIMWAVPQEDWMGIDTVVEPALWTALGFFISREIVGFIGKFKSENV